MFVVLCKDPIVKNCDLGHVRTTNSGAPFSIEVIQQSSHALPNAVIGQGYGRSRFARKIYSNSRAEASTVVSATCVQ